MDDRVAPPPDDTIEVSALDLSFAIPVRATREQIRRLGEWMDEVTNAPYNQPVAGVHWVSGHGSRPKWSRYDAMMLGKAPDSDAPETGEPEFDNSVYQIATTYRPFTNESERQRTLREREKRPRRPSRHSDVIGLAMRQAAKAFGGDDGLFNAAGFGVAFMRIADMRGTLDGEVVRVMLCGRRDVEVLDDGHFRIRGGLP